MKKTILCLVIIAAMLSSALFAGEIKYPFKGKGTGYELLNIIITPMPKGMPKDKAWKSILDVTNDIAIKMQDARKKGDIDKHFYERYRNLMYLSRLNGIKRTEVKDGIKKDYILDMLIKDHLELVGSRHKEKVDQSLPMEKLIHKTLVEELLSLKEYLDKTTKK